MRAIRPRNLPRTRDPEGAEPEPTAFGITARGGFYLLGGLFIFGAAVLICMRVLPVWLNLSLATSSVLAFAGASFWPQADDPVLPQPRRAERIVRAAFIVLSLVFLTTSALMDYYLVHSEGKSPFDALRAVSPMLLQALILGTYALKGRSAPASDPGIKKMQTHPEAALCLMLIGVAMLNFFIAGWML
jgi:hypothetical protein